ncbi:hypothetical protein [Desulfosarcina ovata]|uniref:hypothetical protein n=1 Tax=Desulfosarcina ovata TaxID=83564 RepID=UPI001E49D44A|nr:hypothetical protein [Desulfosarcina ovata]
MGIADTRSANRNNRIICLPFSQGNYECNILNPVDFRTSVNKRIELFPELFPAEIENGYRMKDLYYSKKQSIWIRRIKISGVAYTIRPSFVLPYLVGFVDEIEDAMFFRKFDIPFWAISRVFGKDPMYWYRIEQSIGRNSIVGTTVRNPQDVPEHLAADEKHTRILGEKTYVATTVGDGCILGAAVAKDAGEQALTDAYQVYKQEAQCIKPEYSPETVNMDGWKATRNAWQFLFPAVVIICCFLHVFIKIRDRAKKKYRDIFENATSKLWECYRAESKASFSQRIRRLYEWCEKNAVPSVIIDPITKLRKNIAAYRVAYDHPKAHRTSNMVDRLMQRMDRHLYSTQYFHGSMDAAQLSIRGWTLINNFSPYNPRTVKLHNGFKSPAEQLNQFRYHNNWLQNLYVSASLGGYRRPPQNPI